MTLNLETIKDDLNTLKGPIFTIYLKTDPTNEGWKIRFKNGIKRTEHFVESAQPDNIKLFSKLKREAEKVIKDNQRNFKQGLICFLSEDKTLVYPIQIPVENEFHWEDEPVTHQLDEIIEKYPRCGVILVQQSQVSIFDTELGELTDEAHYELDLDKEDWTQYQGLAYGDVIASGANHRDQFNRRVRENQSRWFKNLIPTVNKHIKKGDWQGIYLAGAAELTSKMKEQLNRRIFGEVNGNYSGRTSLEVVNKILSAVE